MISCRVRKIETQRQDSIQYRVPPLGLPIAPRDSVSQRSGRIYDHAIVRIPATIFLCTGPINLRPLQHQENNILST